MTTSSPSKRFTYEFADQPWQVVIHAAGAAAQMIVSEEQRSADTPQRLFRKVNERIRHLNEPFSSKLARPAAAPGRSSVSVRRREPLRVD